MDSPLFFISDIHLMLDPANDTTEKQGQLFDFFDHVAAARGTLYIVGDLFDFWFEYRHVIPKTYFPFLTRLYRLKQQGVPIHFILGNHDYWVLDFITQTLTTRTYTDDLQLEHAGKRFYITHGDGYLSWDRAYRLLKRLLRNRVFIWSFRWLHPNLAYRLAAYIARRSRHFEHPREYNDKVVADLSDFARLKLAEGFDYVISGHYHQARDIPLDQGRLILLGDWIRSFSYAKFEGNDLTLQFWKAA